MPPPGDRRSRQPLVRGLTTAGIALAAVLLAACTGTSADPVPVRDLAGTTEVLEVDGRPFRVQVPSAYDGARPVPLMLALHGWGSSGPRVAGQLGVSGVTEQRGWLLALPDGTVDSQGRRFWNASAACCNADAVDVDDVGYLTDVVAAVSERFVVDPARVYVAGVSNGGFMAHRLACERADLVSAVVAIAGTTAAGEDRCAPSRGVSVLQVHGTADGIVDYDGGELLPGWSYVSAPDAVAAWRDRGGCAPAAREGAPLDAVATLAGAETTRATWRGCADRSVVSLWTVAGGTHSPSYTPDFAEALVGWLAHHDDVRRPLRR